MSQPGYGPPQPQQPLLTSASRTPTPRPKARFSALDLASALVIPLALAVLLVSFLLTPNENEFAGTERGDGKGLDGAGDTYFPGQGGQGFDVENYAVNLTWDGRVLKGSTTVEATTTEKLDEIHLDLQLPVTEVKVDDQPAEFEVDGSDDLTITPKRALEKGKSFTTTVSYAGDPALAEREPTEQPWFRSAETVTAVGEPYVASWWFPANDHPSDPAQMDIRLTVPAGVEALTVGKLINRDEGSSPETDTWHWQTDKPLPTYTSFVSIGQYEIETGTVQEGMTEPRPYLYAVSEEIDEAKRKSAFEALRTTPKWVGELEKIYGPYPMDEIGGVVPPHDLWFGGMETQARPVYGADSILDPSFQDRLIIHEMAHMWFGDTVHLKSWSELFLNEGYASHAEWLVSEETSGGSANDRLKGRMQKLPPEFWETTLDDPGANTLFDTVYLRGPMALQALRNVIGEDEFRDFSADWATRQGPKSIAQWFDAAKAATDKDLQPWYDAWMSGTKPPPKTKEVGYP